MIPLYFAIMLASMMPTLFFWIVAQVLEPFKRMFD